MDEWGQSSIFANEIGTLDRKQIHIAPEAFRAGKNRFPRDALFDGRIIIFDFQGPEAQIAHVNILGGVFLPAFPTD
jgi:hypothetical protein